MWSETNNKLERTFEFKDFKESIAFIQLVAFAAEKMDHHPEIYNLYNKVELKLCTHSAGDTITAKDKKLAAEIDLIYDGHFNNGK